ncbi:CBS domain-containing protein [Streptomyces sp. NPDC001135]
MYGTPRLVSDVMTQTVAAIGPRAPFKQIVQLMQDWRVSALPVIEGEGRVVGVVSEADLLPKEELRDDPVTGDLRPRRPVDVVKAGALTAGDLMSSPAVTVRAGATLAEAARAMAHAGVKRLPVVDEADLLAGVVSRADLLKVFLRDDEDIAEEVRRELVSYLFPPPASAVQVEVHDGVATLTGRLRDTSLVPVAARLVRAVEGVVDVRFDLARGDRGVTGAGRPLVRRRPTRDDRPHGQSAVCPPPGNERSR